MSNLSLARTPRQLIVVTAIIVTAALTWSGLQAYVRLSSDDCFVNNTYDNQQRLVNSETLCT